MNFTYAGAANNTTNGVALGAAGQDVYIKKLIIGVPVANANITLYNKAVAYNADTGNIAFKTTLPATITYQNSYSYNTVFDFTLGGSAGLQVDGGNLQVDQACQVTVIWEPVDEAKG